MSGKHEKKTGYSVFSISGKLFGLEISSVKEVLKLPRVTRIPNTGKYILGVYNLRGNIISLFDLHQALGLDVQNSESGGMVLVIEEKNLRLSFVVDKVMDFIEIAQSMIQAPINEQNFGNGKFVSGTYQHESFGKIFLLDHNSILVSDSFVEMSA
jgi:purine-binding chemotaxis protein CheW